VFHVVRALDPHATGRTWSAIIGLGFVVLGVLLIRHLHMTRLLIALFLGVIWIIQGVAELMIATLPDQPGRAWSAVFGVVSLAAGIVVLCVPTSSLNVLATLVGIWFIAIGGLQIAGAFYLRREYRRTSRP
jgi:uncharacterized membrane protein HdeD (DUF308 family)